MGQEEKNVLGEEELAAVSGGSHFDCSGKCNFLPDDGKSRKEFDGETYVKCKSVCGEMFAKAMNCSCYGSARCIDKYHRVEQVVGKWWPAPFSENNHNSNDKSLTFG